AVRERRYTHVLAAELLEHNEPTIGEQLREHAGRREAEVPSALDDDARNRLDFAEVQGVVELGEYRLAGLHVPIEPIDVHSDEVRVRARHQIAVIHLREVRQVLGFGRSPARLLEYLSIRGLAILGAPLLE